MFIDVFMNNGKPYLRLMESKRVENDKGVKVSRKSVVEYIGPLNKFDDGQPDYLERLRKSYRAGVPLIPILESYCIDAKPREKYRFTFEEGDPNCFGESKLISHLLIERIMKEIGLRNLFAS